MRLVVFGLLLGLFSVIQAEEIDLERLTIVAAEHRLLQYRHEDELVGPTAEILKLLLKTNIKSGQVQFMPWSRAFARAKTTPNTLIMSMVRTKEREPYFHWITKVSELRRAFISLKQFPENRVTEISHARTKVSAVVRGTYSHNSLIKQGFSNNENLYSVDSIDSAIKLFLNGKVDLIYTAPTVLQNYYASKGLIAEEYIEYDILPETHREAYIAVQIDSDQELVEALKRNNASLVSTEEYKYHLEHKPLISDK